MNIIEKFNQVSQTPEYQNASDIDRDNIRQDLFWNELAPRLDPEEIESTKADYDRMTAPQGDPTSGTFEDVARSFGGGITGLAGDIARLPTLGTPNAVSRGVDTFTDELLQGRSPTAIQADRDTGLQFNSETGSIEIKPNSSLYGLLMQTSGALGSMAPSIGVTGLFTKGASMAARALSGADKAADAAIAANNFSRAREVLAQAAQRDKWARRAGLGMAGATMVGGGTGKQAYDETLRRTQDPELAAQAGREATGLGAALGTVTMGAFDPIEHRLLSGGLGTSRGMNFLKEAGKEGVQETVESGGQEYAAGKAMRDAGLTVDDLGGRSLAVGIYGGALGSIVGGMAGGIGKPGRGYSQQDYDRAIEANNAEALTLEGALNTGNLSDEQRAEHEQKLKDIYRSIAIDEIAKGAAHSEAPEEPEGQPSQAQPQEPNVAEPGERRIPAGEPRDWLPANMPERYENSIKERRELVSQLRRAAQNGLGDDELRQYEARIKAQDELINTNRLAVAHSGNQKYFADKHDFYAWLNRAARGADWERLELLELEARKGRPVDWPAMAQMEQNILQKGDIRDRARILELNHIVKAVEQRMQKVRINPHEGMEVVQRKGIENLRKREAEEEQRQQRRKEGQQRAQANIQQQARAKQERQEAEAQRLAQEAEQQQEAEAQKRTQEEERRRVEEQAQAEAAQAEKQRKHEETVKAKALQDKIDSEHWNESRIGPYHVWAGESDKFAVSGTTKPESGRMHKLGGFFNKSTGSWEFPKSSRPAVEQALREFSKKPQPKEKESAPKVYPKTVQKKVRRSKAKGKEHGKGEFKKLGGMQAAAKPEPVETAPLAPKEEQAIEPKPAAKPAKKTPAAKENGRITHKNLTHIKQIWNRDNKAWGEKKKAELALRSKGLQATHYVEEGGGGFFIKKKPDLGNLSFEHFRIERNGALESVMVPNKMDADVAKAIRAITGEKVVKWSGRYDSEIHDGNGVEKGELVIHLKHSSRDKFFEDLGLTKPKEQAPKPEPKPAPPKESSHEGFAHYAVLADGNPVVAKHMMAFAKSGMSPTQDNIDTFIREQKLNEETANAFREAMAKSVGKTEPEKTEDVSTKPEKVSTSEEPVQKTEKPTYKYGDRVKTRYGTGVVVKVGRKYAQVKDDINGMSSKEPIEKLSHLKPGDRADELQLVSDRFDDLIRKSLKNEGNWNAKPSDLAGFIFDKAKRLEDFPLRNSQQLSGLLEDEGIERKGWLANKVKAIKATMEPPAAPKDHYLKDFSNETGDLSILTLDNLKAIAEKEKYGLKTIMQRIGAHPHVSAETAYEKIQEYLKAKEAENTRSSENETQVTPAESETTSVASPEKNIESGLSALSKVLQTHDDVVSAMTRPDVGDIDFLWGSEGKAPNKSGKRKGAKGIAHIIEARMRKDGMSQEEAEAILPNLIEAIAKGSIVLRQKMDNQKTGKVSENIKIEHGSYRVALVSEDLGKNNHYMLTGFEIEESASDETAKAYDKNRPTHDKPTLSRPAVGAETDSSIKSNTPKNQPVQETARQKRRRRRAGKLIEIDEELSKAADEFAAELKKGMGTVSSGVDPVMLAKFLQHGIKTSSLLIQKGAIKFADWADNMLAIMEDRGFEPEQIAPYLKRLYMATSVEEDIEHLADQMDDRKTVSKFDMDQLLGEEDDSALPPPNEVENEVFGALFSPEFSGREKLDSQVLNNKDDQNARLAARNLVKKAGLDLRVQFLEEGIEEAKDKYKVWIESADKDSVVDRLMDYRKEYQATESAKENPPDQIEGNASATPRRLTTVLSENLTSDNPITNNNQLKTFLAEHHGVLFREVTPKQMKEAQEAMEVALVMQARKTIAEGKGEQDTFNALVEQYQNQPLLNVRSSTSMKNQAYSTPAPLAYLAGHLAGITKNSLVYEPTAGNGMLLINGSVDKASVNELEDLRVKHLRELGYKTTQKDATEYVPIAKHDAVITNPPFGTMRENDGSIKVVRVQGYQIKKLEHLIAAKALEAMKDKGKASIIIGANRKDGEVGAMDKVFFNWLYKHYNVTDHFEINGDLYKRQGAGWPVSVITVEGRKVDGNIIPGLREVSPKTGTIPRLNDWDSIYAHYRKILDARRQRPENIGESSTDSRQQPASENMDELPDKGGRILGGTSSGVSGGLRGDSTAGRAGKPDRPADHGRRPAKSGQRSERPSGDRSGVHATGQDQVARNRKDKAIGSSGHTGGQTGHDVGKLDGSPVQPAVTKSGFQAAYQTASKGFNENVLTPVSMAEATKKALQKITREHGSVDGYVMDRLHYPDKKALYKAFMGLQVDTVAAAIYNAERQPRAKAIIIADQTGVGKGRQAAALIRYARLQGRIPVFMTEKPNLFTDMYDDLADIGEHEVKPFILNKDEFIKGKDGKKLFANVKAKHAKLLKELADADNPELPNGANAIFMTYSQIDQDKVQRRLLTNLRRYKKISWVLDEAHTAAGEREKKVKGGKRITRAGFIYDMIDQGNVLYLSATYAKRPDNMPLYYRTDLMDAVDKEEDLVTALASGGVPLQTVMANMLAESGQLFRRERSFDGISVETVVDYENSAKHRKQYDEVIKGLQAVTNADIVFDKHYFQYHKSAAEEEGGGAVKAGNRASSSINHTNFTSIIHNYVRQLLMAMKVDNVVEKAIESHKKGEKVVIALENTMGSFMEETSSQAGLKAGDVYDSDYRDILLRALERTRRISNKDETGDQAVEQVPLSKLDPITKEAYQDAENIINKLDIGDLPSSPIDYIRYKLEAAGIPTGEITGRKLTIDYAGDTPVLANRPLEEINDRRGTVNKFNDGRIDALILNAAGSTGLSIHASERFTDQRPRKMLVMQASLNINTMMQMLGRINRTGQLVLPSYELMSLDLPAEKRPQSVLSRKMASLNANTSANSKSDTSIDAPDILNKYGSKVIATFMNENPDIARKINMQSDMVAEDKEPPSDLANKFTGRMALLPVKEQEQVYAEIESAYNDLIKYLDSTGQNELNPQTLDLDARIDKSKVIYEGKAPGTVFGGNTTLHKVDAKYQGNPPTPQDVEKSLNKALKDTNPEDIANKLLDRKASDDYLNTITRNREKLTGEWEKLRDESGLTGDLQSIVDYLEHNEDYGEQHKLTKQFRHYRERLEASEAAEAAYKLSKGQTEQGINEYKVGNHYKLDLGDELVTAVVTGIKDSHKAGQGNSYALSKTKVTFAVNSGIRQVEIPFSKLLIAGDGAVVQEKLNSKGTQRLDTLFKIGGLLGDGERREYRYIATGNLISGLAKLPGGRIVNFTDNTKKTHKGILMPKKFGAEQFQAAEGNYLTIRDASIAEKMLRDNGMKLGMLGLSFPGLKGRIYQLSHDTFEITVPKSNKDPVTTRVKFSDELIQAMGTEFYGSGQTMKARFNEGKLADVMDKLLSITNLQVPRSQKDVYKQAGGKLAQAKTDTFEESVEKPIVKHKARQQNGGMSVQRVEKIAEQFIETLNIDDSEFHIVVAKNAEEVHGPGAEEYAGAVLAGKSDKPFVVIHADNHSTPTEVVETLSHEILGHLGLARFLSPGDRRELLRKVIKSQRLLKPVWDDVKSRYGDRPIYEQAEEVVTHLTANPQWKNSRWRSIVNFIVKKLQDFGLFKDYVTRPQIESILSDIADNYKKRKAGNTSYSVGYGTMLKEFGPGTGSRNNRPSLSLKKHTGKLEPPILKRAMSGKETRGETEQDSIKKVVSDLARLDKEAVDRFTANSKGVIRTAKGAMLGALGGRQIAEIYAPLFKKFTDAGVLSSNPITAIANLMQGMQTLRNDWVNKAEKLDQRWARLARNDKRRYKTLADLMYDTTLTQIDPRQPYDNDTDLEDYQRIEAKWNSLPPEAQQLYTDVEQHYKKQFKATQKAMIERAKGLFEPREAHAAIERLKKQFGEVKGPYFPLMRYGDYYIKGLDADNKLYREHFEKEGEYLAAKKQLQDQGITIIEDGKIEPYKGSDTAGVMPFVVKMEKRLIKDNDSPFSRQQKMKFLDELHQVALASLPETSAAKRSMHRRGIAGYDTNARRAFNSTALTGSNRLARVTYGWQVEDTLKRMREATEGNAQSRALTDQENLTVQNVITELKKRHELNMNPNTHPASAWATNFAFFNYLGGSLGAGIVNLTQTPLLTLPALGGRYGYRRTARYMAKASADYLMKGKREFADSTDFMTNAWFTLENNQGITADERKLVKALIDDGTIETTQASTVAGNAGVDLDQPRAINRDWYNTAVRASGIFFHNAEVMNRQVSALASYRLWRDDLLKRKPAGYTLTPEDIAKGAAFARKTTFDTHFDYSNYNRPRYMKGNWARVFLIFKQYSQNMAYLLGRTFYNATKNKDLSKEERTIARRQMAGILGMSTLASGLMGLPGIALLKWFAEAVGGDDDDPYDAEVEFRKYLAGLFGKDVAHALSKGVINGFTGIDLYSRVKLSDLFYSSNNRELSPRDEAVSALTTAAGPFFGHLINSWVGLQETMEGDGWTGMERMMPKFVRDGMRAVRYSREGLVDSHGNVMVEDFSPFELAMRVGGLGSARESEAWDARSAVKGYQAKIGKRRSTLLNQYDKAKRENDQDAMRDVMEQISGFNAARRTNDQPEITSQTLRQSSKQRERRRRQTEKGVYLPSTQLGLRDLTTGYAY